MAQPPETPEGAPPGIRQWTKWALAAFPAVAGTIYALGYLYALQFLAQFGVSPEEVGVNEFKLVTRAAIYTVLFFAFFLVVPLGVLLPIIYLTGLGRPSVAGWRALANRPRVLRCLTVFLSVILTLLLSLLLQPMTAASLEGTAAITVLVAVWPIVRILRRRPLVVPGACLSVWLVALLAFTAVSGAAQEATRAADTGKIPFPLYLIGVDIVPVTPTWLTAPARPRGYANEVLLELGSDGGTVFLYDCRAAMTYRVPLADVVLNYSVRTSIPATRLRCR
jgi:hypothetical protein